MDWTEKIEKAMNDLSNACKENHEWRDCYKCPFTQYCDCIAKVYDSYPQDWVDDDDDDWD